MLLGGFQGLLLREKEERGYIRGKGKIEEGRQGKE